MPRFQKILVPLQTVRPDGHALEFANDLAERHDGEIFLLLTNIAHSESSEQKYFWLMAEDEDAARAASADRARIHRAHLDEAPIAPGILDYSANNEIDLIVMETYGHRSLGRFVFGGTAGEVVRWSECPVLTVRKQKSISDPLSLQRLLVPVDFSRYSIGALREARDLAREYEASIQLLFVYEERPRPLFDKAGPSGATPQKMQKDAEVFARGALKDLYGQLEGAEVPVSFRVRRGHVSKEILDFAATQSSDMLITTSHGLTDNPDFSLGSVAEKITRRARCPVLTLKARHASVPESAEQPAIVD